MAFPLAVTFCGLQTMGLVFAVNPIKVLEKGDESKTVTQAEKPMNLKICLISSIPEFSVE